MKKFRIVILIVALIAAVFSAGYLPQAEKPVEQLTLADGGYMTSCAVILAIFCISFCLSLIGGKLQMSPFSRLLVGMGAVVLLLIGVTYLIIKVTAGVISWLWGIGAPVIVAALFVWLYFRYRRIYGNQAAANSVRKSASGVGEIKFAFRVLYASMALLLIISVIALIVGQPTAYMMLPLAFASLSILLWRLLKWRGFNLIGAVTIVLYVVKYCIPAYISFSQDKFWPSLVLTLLYLGLIVPLSDLYCRKESGI